MTNFQKALLEAANFELRESNGKINQTDRNNLRAKLMAALQQDLADAVFTADGLILPFGHEEWGELHLEISIKMKDPEYDMYTARAEYEEKLAKAEAKRIEAEKKAAARAAKKNPE